MDPQELINIILNFTDTNGEHYTIEEINETLKTHPDFYFLDLAQANPSLNKGEFKAIADVLKYNTTLTKLSLSEISVDGMKAIAEALETNQSLRILDVHFQDFNISIARTLGSILKYNKTLTCLDFSRCQFTREHKKLVNEISEGLKTNYSLIKLNIKIDPTEYEKENLEIGRKFIRSIPDFSTFTLNEEHIKFKKDKEEILNPIRVLIERNERLLENFADKLIDIEKNKPVKQNIEIKINEKAREEEKKISYHLKSPINLSLNSLAYFKSCDIRELTSYSPKEIEFFNKLSEVYLHPSFYINNFWMLAGICKTLPYTPNEKKIGISNLPKSIIKEILSYIPQEEYKFKLAVGKEKKAILKRKLESYEEIPLKTNDKKAKFQEGKEVSILNSDNFGKLVSLIKDSSQTKEAIKLITKMKKFELLSQDNEGRTALHWATYKGNELIVKILIVKQPNLIPIVDKEDNSALVVALVEEHNNIARLLNPYSIRNNNNQQVEDISPKGKEEKDDENHTNDALSLYENHGLSGEGGHVFEDH